MTDNRLFDLIAPHYDRLFRAPELERIAAALRLPASGWMLDAGGGTGRVSAGLRGAVDRLLITDLSLPMLQAAGARTRANGRAAPALAQARVEWLPFAAETFARILVVDAFHHFGDQPGAVRELARLLRPDGLLLIVEPDINRLPVKLVALGERLLGMGSRFHTAERMRGFLASCGLQARAEREGATAWVTGWKGAPA